MKAVLVPECIVRFTIVEGDGGARVEGDRLVLVAPEEGSLAAVVGATHPPVQLA